MASPVSFGDAYLMAQMTWTIARAFTKGRKSAPAEFREIENQLYSLSAALSALRSARVAGKAAVSIDQALLPKTSQTEDRDGRYTVDTILGHCKQTLKHLEQIVSKYNVVTQSSDPSKPRLERWSQDLVRNWRKIAWTSENGDLATLRSQLMIHTNSLNLILGVIINSQSASIKDETALIKWQTMATGEQTARIERRTTDIEDQGARIEAQTIQIQGRAARIEGQTGRIEVEVERSSAMLREIYEWYLNNLRDTASREVVVSSGGSAPGSAGSTVPDTSFELGVEISEGVRILCPQARLHPSWNAENANGAAEEQPVLPRLFVCACSQSSSQPHQAAVAAYRLCDLTYPVRLTGPDRIWLLYKALDANTNRLVSVRIQKVSLSYIAEFEETFVDWLATTKARSMLEGGVNNMLAYADTGQGGRILTLLGDTKLVEQTIDKVTFSIRPRAYSRDCIDSILILHYRRVDELADSEDWEDLVELSFLGAGSSNHLDYAEVLVFYGGGDAEAATDVSKTVLLLRRETPLSLNEAHGTVQMKNVESTSFARDKQICLNRADAAFEFMTAEGARLFHARLEEMRMELFLLSLQYPRKDETVRVRLQGAQVHCKAFSILDAEITIVQDSQRKFRLIIVSRNRCTILSQVLADDFFTGSAVGDWWPNFASLTYLVQLQDRGRRVVHKYENGFKDLRLQSSQSDRMFKLARDAIITSVPP